MSLTLSKEHCIFNGPQAVQLMVQYLQSQLQWLVKFKYNGNTWMHFFKYENDGYSPGI